MALRLVEPRRDRVRRRPRTAGDGPDGHRRGPWVVEDELTSYLPDEGLAHWQWGASEAAGGVLSGALPGEDGLTIRPSFGDSSGIDDWQVLSTGTGSTSGFSTDFEGGLADAWQDAADFGTDDGDLVASGGGKMWREQSSATGVFEVQDVQNTASYTGIRSAFVAQETKYDGAEGYGLRWIQHRNDSNDEDYWSGDIRLERLDSPADKGPTTLAKLTADHDGRVNTVRVERTKTDESDDGDEEYTFEWTLTYADGTTKSGTYVEGFDETSYTESDYWVQRHDSGGASQRVGGISVEGRDGVGWTSLSTEDPVTIRTEVSRDLQTYVGYKRDKIERIRNITTAMFADYDTPKDPASVDSAAERYLDNLEPRLDEMGPDEARLHMEVLQRLNAGERVSLAALNAVNAELGLNDQTVVEQFADAAVDALSSFMMGKLFERVARVGRAGSSSATRKLIQSSTFEDFVTGLNRQVDSVFFGSTFGDEFYERIVRTVKRDQLAFYHLWEDDDLGGSITNLYQTSIKHGGSLPSFDEGGNLAGASFFTQVEKMLDEAKRYVERTTYESAVFRDDGIPNQMPVEFGPVSRELPNIPDAVPVPYADEAEDAANTVLGWIEETAESAGEIKELPSVNIEQLEDPEIDLPDEIPLPDAWSFPEEVGIDRIEIDAGRAINQVDELIPLGYSGVGAELAEEVTILVDKVREGELDRQPAEIRSKLVSLYVDFYEQLVAGMEVMFTGYDVMRKIGDIAERIALGVAGVTVLVVSMLSLIGFGAGLVLVPVLAIYVEIIGLLNVVVAAVEGITGYAFLATAMTGHSASVTKLLNADLKRLEEVL
ncbi:hypothetical protein BRC81_04725 [Halobacteriales archaeon QS_1_68_20]|nr:MAG: hypothetical protein BRC81_04725 [Halobacteriales archaeon QS_1_68_20]